MLGVLLCACHSAPRRDPVAIVATSARSFGGWVAILGGGANATAGSDDWHMDRNLRIDSDGKPVAVNWRDGQASGHALTLERITVRQEQRPLLKLSIVDAKGQVIAYAWSDADADRIGLSLGWIQIGLDAVAPVARWK